MSSSGSLKKSFFVLWFTISDLSRSSDRKPCSPPVKAAFADALVRPGIVFSSLDGAGLLPPPPLRYR